VLGRKIPRKEKNKENIDKGLRWIWKVGRKVGREERKAGREVRKEGKEKVEFKFRERNVGRKLEEYREHNGAFLLNCWSESVGINQQVLKMK
jgi:hypothetical protein